MSRPQRNKRAKSKKHSKKRGQKIGRTKRRRSSSRLNRRRGRRRAILSHVDFSQLREPKAMSGVKFNYYIKKVLKKVKPKLGITVESQRILDQLMKGTMHRIVSQAASKMGRRKVLVPKVLVRGMRQILPKAIRTKADERGQVALTRYLKSKKSRRR